METEMKQKINSWVEKAFENEKFSKIECEFPESDTTGGYSSEIVYVNVKTEKGEDKKTYSIIVKKNKDNEAMMETLNFREIYRKEVYFFATYLPYLRKFAEKRNSAPFEDVPRCYGTVNEEKHLVILMENLKPKNYKTHPLGEQSMTLDHVKLVVAAYARFHAFGFAVKDQDPAVLMEEFAKPTSLLENEFLMKSICASMEIELENVANLYKDKNDMKLVEILMKLKNDYYQIWRASLECKNDNYLVPRHGDSWNNNFLFHFNEEKNVPDKVIIIDWQAGLMGNPMVDLVQYLFYCASKKELEHLDDILKLYYDILSSKIKELGSDPAKLFPWSAFKKSFERYAPLGIAGVPLCTRMCFKSNTKTYDFSDTLKEGNIGGMFGNDITNPKKYFERIDGVLKLAVQRKLI